MVFWVVKATGFHESTVGVGCAMGFEIKPRKSLEKNLRKLVKSQVEKAASALRGEDELPVAEVVHEVRKRFKRIRALARLSKHALGDEVADRLNHAFRDASRPLSASRDANVLVKTLDGLAERWTPSERPDVFASIRETLKARHQETRREAIEEGDVFTTVHDAMMDAYRTFKRSDFPETTGMRLPKG